MKKTKTYKPSPVGRKTIFYKMGHVARFEYPAHFTNQQCGLTAPGGVKGYFLGLNGDPLKIAANARK